MKIDIKVIPNAMESRQNLPQPDWDAIADWVEGNFDPSDFHEAYLQLGYQWLELLAESLPVRYSIEQSEEFYILSADDSSTNNRMLQWCEAIHKNILTTLKDVASDEGCGNHVVLVFHNWETYYDYVTDFYLDSGEFALSGGMFINHGYSHFAICTQGNSQVERTIAHELTHTMLTRIIH